MCVSNGIVECLLQVYGWGGCTCLGSDTDILTPVLVDGLRGMRIVDITCGDRYTLAVRDSK